MADAACGRVLIRIESEQDVHCDATCKAQTA